MSTVTVRIILSNGFRAEYKDVEETSQYIKPELGGYIVIEENMWHFYNMSNIERIHIVRNDVEHESRNYSNLERR